MRIKSYFANSVPEAIEKARLELGSNAMLLNSKKTEIDLQVLGAYEVVFGIANDAAAPVAGKTPVEKNAASQFTTRTSGLPATTTTGGPLRPAAGSDAQAGDVVRELADLRKQIDSVRRSVNRQGRAQPDSAGRGGGCLEERFDDIVAHLLAADFGEELAQEIAEAVAARMESNRDSGSSPEVFKNALLGELEGRFSVAPESGGPGQPRTVLFAGPPGVGKTTSLIKLALRCSLQAQIPVQILSLDTLRIGGWELLASYARITGLPFEAIQTLPALGQALREGGSKGLIFIDTPGFSASDLREKPDLAAWLARDTGIEVQLVLPAMWRPRVALRAVERFAAFRPAKLLLTHLDEVEAPGEALEVAMRAGLPLSYVADGQQIPEDIHAASKERLLASLGECSRRLMASAA